MLKEIMDFISKDPNVSSILLTSDEFLILYNELKKEHLLYRPSPPLKRIIEKLSWFRVITNLVHDYSDPQYLKRLDDWNSSIIDRCKRDSIELNCPEGPVSVYRGQPILPIPSNRCED